MTKLSKVKWCLLGCLIVLLVLAVSSVLVPSKTSGVVEWVANNDFASTLRSFSEQEARRENNLTEMVVETVRISKVDYQPVVILKEKEGELYLPIGVGLLEANAISVVLEGATVPRPLTSDLLCSIIDRAGARVSHIVIDGLQEHIFYANIALYANWMELEIDARPSDAIAIALRVRAPIYVTKVVLEKAGIPGAQTAEEYTFIRSETIILGQLENAAPSNCFGQSVADA